MAPRVPTEIQPLAFVAPAPIVLPRSRRDIVNQSVISTSRLIVSASGRAVASGVPCEIQSLALVTPAPITLLKNVDIVKRRSDHGRIFGGLHHLLVVGRRPRPQSRTTRPRLEVCSDGGGGPVVT